MKTLLLLFVVGMTTSCVTTTTTTTAPDGTVTVVETVGIDAATVTTVSAAATEIAKTAHPVEPAK